jgi:histidinol phosphatase-like PHP family hydrolase
MTLAVRFYDRDGAADFTLPQRSVTLITDDWPASLYAFQMNSSFSRRTFLETSVLASAALAAPIHLGARGAASATPPKPAFPVADYHVHLSPTLTIDQAVSLGKERGVQIGVVEHPGPNEKLKTDADLREYIDMLRKYPVRVGIQPIYPGWSKSFSKTLLDELDYALMDAITLPNSDGSSLATWQIDTHVDDEEEFMTRYMRFIEQVLTTEPIDIFAWPTFLPVPIAREYKRLWTRPRVDHIIDLAKRKKIAIEINEVAHVPDEDFILSAKRAGLKFTFGSDSRNQNAAHFYYCYQMAQKCGLTEGDMWAPKKK